jgi:hypothetical protein
MPSSPSSLAPTTGTMFSGSNTPMRRRPSEAIKRSAVSCDTFAVETIGYSGWTLVRAEVNHKRRRRRR